MVELKKALGHTLEVIRISVVITIVTLRLLHRLVHTVLAEASDLVDIEAVVGADALVLKQILVPVDVAHQIGVTIIREGSEGLTDGLARRRDISHVKLNIWYLLLLSIGEKGQWRDSQGNGGDGVTHDERPDYFLMRKFQDELIDRLMNVVNRDAKFEKKKSWGMYRVLYTWAVHLRIPQDTLGALGAGRGGRRRRKKV